MLSDPKDELKILRHIAEGDEYAELFNTASDDAKRIAAVLVDKVGHDEEYNAALEWAASWVTGSQMLGHSADVVEFAQNMAMSIRAAKRTRNTPKE